MTQLTGKTVLVTGGNRGIGRALVEEALARGAQRVYASTRRSWTHPDERVTALDFDVTDPAAIRAAAGTDDLEEAFLRLIREREQEQVTA